MDPPSDACRLTARLRPQVPNDGSLGSNGNGDGASAFPISVIAPTSGTYSISLAYRAGLPAGGCHGSMPESTRRADLAAFRSNPPSQPLLVCTDVSARGGRLHYFTSR